MSCSKAHPPATQGHRTDVDGIPVIQLRGTPYERGFQHGSLCINDLRRYRQRAWTYAPRTATARLGVPAWLATWLIKPVLFFLAGTYLPQLHRDVREEMQGLSDGADVDLREVAV